MNHRSTAKGAPLDHTALAEFVDECGGEERGASFAVAAADLFKQCIGEAGLRGELAQARAVEDVDVGIPGELPRIHDVHAQQLLSILGMDGVKLDCQQIADSR